MLLSFGFAVNTAMSYSVILANNYSVKFKELSAKKALQQVDNTPSVSAKPLLMHNTTLHLAA